MSVQNMYNKSEVGEVISEVQVLQYNIGHRFAAHDFLMDWLIKEEKLWILCIQEPYFSKRGLSNMPRTYGAFWMNNEDSKHRIRALVVAPISLKGYMVTQLSTPDRVIVRFEKLQISVASIYCAVDKNIMDSMHGYFHECTLSKNTVACIDSNAYHHRWGSDMKKNRKWSCRKRGEILIDEIDENNVCICNELPHAPTFVRDSKKKDESHIDITLCSPATFNRIYEWHISDTMFGSDHRGIKFRMNVGRVNIDKGQVAYKGVPWKKMNVKMNSVVTDVLQKRLKDETWVRNPEQVDMFIKKHTDSVRTVLNNVFKSKRKQQAKKVHWWNNDVAVVYKKLKMARNRMRRYKHENLRIAFYEIRQEFRSVIKEAKLNAWRVFTSNTLDPWDKLIKIVRATSSGKIQSRTLTDLNGHFAETISETLTMLGRQFYPPPKPMTTEHSAVECRVQKELVHVQKGPNITLCEFRTALAQMSRSTAPGFDEITNNVLCILIKDCKFEGRYLKMFNVCLKNFHFPSAWKEAKIVLIPKKALDANSVKAYRPISLTSVYAKLFERILLARLLHYLCESGRMNENQHAYNKGKSTQTALFDMFDVVQQALGKRGKGVCVIVFLDISGAFDKTWHAGILAKLLEYGVPKYMICMIQNFLSNRKAFFEDSDVTHTVELGQGCPQGGVLSPILWNVLFNDLFSLPIGKMPRRGDILKVIGYADDAALVCKANSVEEASAILNQHLEKIHNWSISNRVEFNVTKLAVLTVSNRARTPPPATVFYNGVLISEVQRYKYLGLIVDNKLLWKDQIEATVNKLSIITRSLRGLSREGWGIRLDIYRLLFHSIFMPILTYGIAIWGFRATSKTVCMKFDKQIRLYCLQATRCQKSTSSEYLFALMRTPAFASILRNEVLKVSVQQFHVVHTTRQGSYEDYAKRRITRQVPQNIDHHFFMCRKGLQDELQSCSFTDANKQYYVHPSKWALTNIRINEKSSAIRIGAEQVGWVVYTDASRTARGLGWSNIVIRNGFLVERNYGALTKCSIYKAESYAVLQAVRYVRSIKTLRSNEVVEIRSDSLAVVVALEKTHHDDELLHEVKAELRGAYQQGINIVLRWVPSHQNIYGNEEADKLAKKATDSRSVHDVGNSQQEVRAMLKNDQRRKAADDWGKVRSRNVKLFLPDINMVHSFIKSSPSVPLCQLVSGHSRLNDFICTKLGLINSALCACKTGNETVSHFLFDCPLYDGIRQEIWTDFVPDYAYITKRWDLLNDFVLKTGRFDGNVRDVIRKRGEEA